MSACWACGRFSRGLLRCVSRGCCSSGWSVRGGSGARHRLATILTVVVARLRVPVGTAEVTQVRDLLVGVDLAGRVLTADALSRHRDNASYAEVVVMPKLTDGRSIVGSCTDRPSDDRRSVPRSGSRSAWATPRSPDTTTRSTRWRSARRPDGGYSQPPTTS